MRQIATEVKAGDVFLLRHGTSRVSAIAVQELRNGHARLLVFLDQSAVRADNNATDEILELLHGLPAGRRFETLEEVWETVR